MQKIKNDLDPRQMNEKYKLTIRSAAQALKSLRERNKVFLISIMFFSTWTRD